MAVAINETKDTCLNCQQEVMWGHQDPEKEPTNWYRPLWFHTATRQPNCLDDESTPEVPHYGMSKAKPVHHCIARIQDYGGICNRPVVEFGSCRIHSKDARVAWERDQKIRELKEQDAFVQEQLGTIIDHWNEFYDLDAKLHEVHDGNDYSYRSGNARYTGYVVVNPARFVELLKKIEEEF